MCFILKWREATEMLYFLWQTVCPFWRPKKILKKFYFEFSFGQLIFEVKRSYLQILKKILILKVTLNFFKMNTLPSTRRQFCHKKIELIKIFVIYSNVSNLERRWNELNHSTLPLTGAGWDILAGSWPAPCAHRPHPLQLSIQALERSGPLRTQGDDINFIQ